MGTKVPRKTRCGKRELQSQGWVWSSTSDLTFGLPGWNFLCPNEGEQHSLSQIPLRSLFLTPAPKSSPCTRSQLKGKQHSPCLVVNEQLPCSMDPEPQSQLQHPLAPPWPRVGCREQHSLQHFLSDTESNGSREYFGVWGRAELRPRLLWLLPGRDPELRLGYSCGSRGRRVLLGNAAAPGNHPVLAPGKLPAAPGRTHGWSRDAAAGATQGTSCKALSEVH